MCTSASLSTVSMPGAEATITSLRVLQHASAVCKWIAGSAGKSPGPLTAKHYQVVQQDVLNSIGGPFGQHFPRRLGAIDCKRIFRCSASMLCDCCCCAAFCFALLCWCVGAVAVMLTYRLLHTKEGLYLALVIASASGHVSLVQELISSGTDVNADDVRRDQDKASEVPLHAAAQFGHTEVMKLLISSEADIDIHWKGATALVRAAQNGHVASLQLLLDEGADADRGCYRDGLTPLEYAEWMLWDTGQPQQEQVLASLQRLARPWKLKLRVAWRWAMGWKASCDH